MLDDGLNGIKRTLGGDLSLFGGPSTDETVAGRLRAEQLAPILKHTRGIMVANACNALIFFTSQWGTPDVGLAGVWASLVIAIATIVYRRQRARAGKPKPRTVSERAIYRATAYGILLGGLWSAVPLLFFNSAGSGEQVIIACLCSGMLAGGAFGLASVPVAAVAFTGPIFVGSAIALGRTGDPTYALVAALMVVYAIVLLRAVFAHAVQSAVLLVAQFDMERQIRLDPLTQLPNRISFEENVEAAFARLKRNGEPFALFCLDLNSFKPINDRLGHAAGDEILVQIAERLRRCERATDMFARLGGDEFALVAAGVAEADDGATIARQIVDAFAQPFHIDGQEVFTTVSIGASLAPTDGCDQRSLLRSADIALYHAKSTRGGSYRFFDASDQARARERRTLEHDLHNALHHREFRLVFQPILGLAEDRITGFEALLRWQHPSRGLVSPAEFIPVAESTGLIRPIGEWVLHEACRTAAGWPDDIRVSVNFSAIQFRDPRIVELVTEALDATKLSPRRLEIEVTETMLISEGEPAVAILRSLSRSGIQIALDDFGTGYSSLSYLRDLPLDRIKVDQSFIHHLTTNPHSASIVKSLIGLASELGMNTSAEGVETAEQLAFLRHHKCGEAQGYLIGRPTNALEATAMLGDSCRTA